MPSRLPSGSLDINERGIKLVLEYDGTRFLGFQTQRKGRTVQGELERALFRILRERIRVVPAGRTDSGVHARGQVVHFVTRSNIPLRGLQHALNTYLPEDVVVKDLEPVGSGFHARFKAKRKIYSYRILMDPVRSPLSRFYATHYFYPLDVSLIRKGARFLRGRHDFRSFQAHADGKKNTVRTLYRLGVKEEGSYLTLTFEGDGFLYNMVRNIVGTLLELGRGKITWGEFKKIIHSRDRRFAGPTAPPHGLTLEEVIYED